MRLQAHKISPRQSRASRGGGREVFNTKPGKAKDLVAKFKKASAEMRKESFHTWVITDTVASYWMVEVEVEVENLSCQQRYLVSANLKRSRF